MQYFEIICYIKTFNLAIEHLELESVQIRVVIFFCLCHGILHKMHLCFSVNHSIILAFKQTQEKLLWT